MNGRNPCAINFARLLEHAFRLQGRTNTALQLCCRFFGKRNCKHLVDIIYPTCGAFKSMRNALCEREGFARARTRRNIYGAHKLSNTFFLFRRVPHG